MAISEATINELGVILEEDYGKKLTKAEVADIAMSLVRYFDLISKIYHRALNKNDDDKTKNNGRD